MKRILVIFLLAMVFRSVAAATLPPPTLSGPAVVLPGVSSTYSYTGLVVAPMWEITTGTATITSTWVSGSTYYASVTWTTSGTVHFFDEVEGANVSAVVTAMSAPSVANAYRCGTGTVQFSTTLSGATQVRWWSAASGGTLLNSTTTYTTPSLTTGTYSYWVERYNSTYSLTTARVQVTATVVTTPSVPTATNGPRCGPGTVNLVATPDSPSNTVRWYSAPVGGVLLDTALSLVTPELNRDTYYYITSFHLASGCESSRVPIHAIVYQKPDNVSTIVNAPIYGSGSTTLSTSFMAVKRGVPIGTYVPDTADFEVGWYATEAHALARTNRLANTLVFTTPMISHSTAYFVRVRDKTTGCLGDVAIATVQITPFVATQNIRTDALRVLGKTTESDLLTLGDYDKTTTITYLDGISRPRQQSIVRGGANGKDVVQPIEYDAQGRSSKSFLPYVANDSTGSFHSDYFASQLNFYLADADKVANDSAAYTQTVFEQSPLSRVMEQGNVGRDFQPGTGHTSKVEYGLNTSGDQVRKFNAKADSSWYYDAKKLSKVKSIDANGNHVITFSDGEGRTILVRQQLDATIDGVSTPYLETYYLYNDLGQQTYIISPKGVAELKASSWNFSQTIKDSYTNQFRYDDKGRVIEKKVPGQAWQSIVYDPLGRIVLTQDGLLKGGNKWMFIKYDYSGNAVMTGIHTNTTYTTRATMQTYVNGIYVSGHASFGAETWYEKQGSTLEGYTSQSFPNASIDVLSVNYFDDYDFDNTGGADVSYLTGLAGEHTPTELVRGLPTGSKRKILGTATWLKTYVFYDDRFRSIQLQTSNPLNPTALDYVTTVYADDGRVLKSYKHHEPGTPGAVNVLNTYEYSNDGRLSGIRQKNNSGTDQRVVKYEYNSLGQVIDKKLHNTSGNTYLQSVDYRYTIRGQLKSINNSELASNTSNDDSNDYFGMELVYNESEAGLTTTAKYDGNISAMKWKGAGATPGSTGQKSYAYSYDKTGRLETASFTAKGSSWSEQAGVQNESMSYDQNGNIKTLTRKQRKYDIATDAYSAETIDNLTYSYASTDKNRLTKIEDPSTVSGGFANGANTTTEYRYDLNGNLTSDKNKGIDSIYYNFLGKPVRMDFSDHKRIEYVYDAGGSKLTQKLFHYDTLRTTTHYVNGFVYEADRSSSPVLSFFSSPEGRVVKNGSNLDYEYSIADHQGNTRVVFSSASAATQSHLADFESPTNTYFPNYPSGGARNGTALYNNTSSGTYSQALNGGYTSQVGVAKSFKVYPGDKVKIEAYGKYVANGGGTNITGFATALATAFNVSSSSTGEALRAFTALDDYGAYIAAGGVGQELDDDFPKLFVTILVFDKDHKFVDAAWDQIGGGKQIGVSPDVPHDLMSKEVTINAEGYVYMYVSNENATQVDFYVDDVVMSYTPGNIVQYNEYYPFGLQASASWTRTDAKDNNYLYNAANELNKTNGWYEMYYRGYDPAIGRMLQVDPYAPLYASLNTYNYAMNNPVMMNDPTGGQAEGPYADFWNTVLAGVKAKAYEAGWYGGSWSEDKGENIYDYNEMSSAIDILEKQYEDTPLLGMDIEIAYTDKPINIDGKRRAGSTRLNPDRSDFIGENGRKNGQIRLHFTISLDASIQCEPFIGDNDPLYERNTIAHEFGHVLHYMELLKDLPREIANSKMNDDERELYFLQRMNDAVIEMEKIDYDYRENRANRLAQNYFGFHQAKDPYFRD